jgi:hypothetical protein
MCFFSPSTVTQSPPGPLTLLTAAGGNTVTVRSKAYTLENNDPDNVVGATVVADTAAWADALSKVPFVDPDRRDCFQYASCLVMYADGTSSTIGTFPA